MKDCLYHDDVGRLDSKNEWLKAYKTLQSAGPEALSAILEGTESESSRIRRFCISLLDHLADEESVKFLIKALDDPDSSVRRLAVHSVG